MEQVLVIPARMHSTRLPGKPLINILGKSVLLRTWEQCSKAFPSNKIYVATDNSLIEKHCLSHGINVVMTPKECITGTDRVAYFARTIPADIYINVQGDEPIINPKNIKKVIDKSMQHPNDIINGFAKIKDSKQYYSKNIPKVVTRPDGRLLYMSRSPIPGNKKGEFQKAWRQVCIYAFPKKSLQKFTSTQDKTELEYQEDIEILRFLELGFDVRMIHLNSDSIAVDTRDDVDLVIKYLS